MQREKITDETTHPHEPPTKNTMGRPSFIPNAEQKGTVAKMATFGIPVIEIAMHLRISPKTLRKHFRTELKYAAYDANNAVLGSLFTMATTRHTAAAAIFWAKKLLHKNRQPRKSAP